MHKIKCHLKYLQFAVLSRIFDVELTRLRSPWDISCMFHKFCYRRNAKCYPSAVAGLKMPNLLMRSIFYVFLLFSDAKYRKIGQIISNLRDSPRAPCPIRRKVQNIQNRGTKESTSRQRLRIITWLYTVIQNLQLNRF